MTHQPKPHFDQAAHDLEAIRRYGAPDKDRLVVSKSTANHAQELGLETVDRIHFTTTDGTSIPLPADVEAMLIGALRAIATRGRVLIEQLPEELTSTRAAELLGVSRPTLMKWARQNRLPSFKVGSHTRFHTTDVQAFQRTLRAERTGGDHTS